MELSKQVGLRDPQAGAMSDLGDIYTSLGEPRTAADHHRHALKIFEEIGSRYGQAKALNGLGEANLAAGRPRDAIIDHTAALDVAVDSGDRAPQARAHTGLGQAHQALGDTGRARHHWRQALAIYTDLGMPEATQVRAQLAMLDDPAHRN
jgi:tetratricopeptide (TPR) repeat protein